MHYGSERGIIKETKEVWHLPEWPQSWELYKIMFFRFSDPSKSTSSFFWLGFTEIQTTLTSAYACVHTLCFWMGFLLQVFSYLFPLGNATFAIFSNDIPKILIRHIWKDNPLINIYFLNIFFRYPHFSEDSP